MIGPACWNRTSVPNLGNSCTFHCTKASVWRIVIESNYPRFQGPSFRGSLSPSDATIHYLLS